MKLVKYLSILLASVFLIWACQKEVSQESGFAGSLATGSLLDTANDCKNIAVVGSYFTDSTLTDSNYVIVQVNFKTGGSYKVFTNTENGFSFQDSGFIGPGLRSIKLKATGRPILARETTFQVAFDTSFCSFSVPVIGRTPATYTLTGSPGNCSNASVTGTYTAGTALTANNQVTLGVNVTATGSYTVSTSPVNGMTFSGTGNFASLGVQTITLRGSGTPTTAGSNTIAVTAGSSNCNFTVNVTAGTGGSVNPNASDTAWQFTSGTNSFKGPFFDVFDSTINNTYGVVFLGYTPSTGDTTIQFGTFFTGTSIQPGSYQTKNFAAFYFTDYRDTAKPVKLYTADFTTTAVNTIINITTYDSTTKIITGTFSGNALNAAKATVPITNGRFRARVR